MLTELRKVGGFRALDRARTRAHPQLMIAILETADTIARANDQEMSEMLRTEREIPYETALARAEEIATQDVKCAIDIEIARGMARIEDIVRVLRVARFACARANAPAHAYMRAYSERAREFEECAREIIACVNAFVLDSPRAELAPAPTPAPAPARRRGARTPARARDVLTRKISVARAATRTEKAMRAELARVQKINSSLDNAHAQCVAALSVMLF